MKRVITTMLSMMISFWGIAQTTWYNQNSGTNKQLSDVCFIDQNNGWVCGWTGTMLHTTDGGATWIPQTVPPNNAYYSVSFTDANNGWACGYSGKIIHTSDGGENWALQNSPTTYYLNSIFFVDSLQGWAAGGTSGTFPSYIHTRIILNTTNGGATWNTQYVQSYEDVLYSISFVDDMNGFATGEGGVFMHTTNGGINWDVQTVNASFQFFRHLNFIRR